MVRFKNRYISVEIDNGLSITQPLNVNPQELYNEIINKVKFVHGIVGLGSVKPGLKVIYCNELTRIIIIRVRHGPHRLISSILPLLKKIKNIDCSLKIIYVGATLQHCYKAILKHQKKVLPGVLPSFNFEEWSENKSKFDNLGNLKSDEILTPRNSLKF